jgi:hypothetical protein
VNSSNSNFFAPVFFFLLFGIAIGESSIDWVAVIALIELRENV